MAETLLKSQMTGIPSHGLGSRPGPPRAPGGAGGHRDGTDRAPAGGDRGPDPIGTRLSRRHSQAQTPRLPARDHSAETRRGERCREARCGRQRCRQGEAGKPGEWTVSGGRRMENAGFRVLRKTGRTQPKGRAGWNGERTRSIDAGGEDRSGRRPGPRLPVHRRRQRQCAGLGSVRQTVSGGAKLLPGACRDLLPKRQAWGARGRRPILDKGEEKIGSNNI